MSPTGLGPENDRAGEDQQQMLTTDPTSRQRECYIKITTASVQLENKIAGREYQGACRQDELIGGNTARSKVTVTLTLKGIVQ
jgi:hypothetical protein